MTLTAAEIRDLRSDNPRIRARDLADANGLCEAQIVAAHVGHGARVIDATPDRLMPLVQALGDVLALTRNASCVHERHGVYDDYRPGAHAQMVLGAEIDLRIFPAHWVHAFAVEEPGKEGVKRSVQVFDAAGDAVHKVHLTAGSDAGGFATLVDRLSRPDQPQALALAPRAAVQAAKADPVRIDALRAEWAGMTDTHQFLRMVHRLGMNRLGAYRIVGGPQAVRLQPEAVTQALFAASDAACSVMIFVGNRGCIQIHGGLIDRVVPMGPWINVMDPRFNLHLRADRLAEVWLVDKPTRHGPILSVEGFDDRGELILQIFGSRKDNSIAAWNAICAGMPRLEEVPA